MSQYELAQQILFRLARYSAETYEYADTWNDKVCKNNVIDGVTMIREDKSFVEINPTEFTKEEMISLGFGTWEDNGMYLIPLWIYPFLKAEFKCVSISGEEIIFNKSTCDNDHRYGQTAYQVKPYVGETK